jgi:hypothetical protein
MNRIRCLLLTQDNGSRVSSTDRFAGIGIILVGPGSKEKAGAPAPKKSGE